jgi:hypothetical protein
MMAAVLELVVLFALGIVRGALCVCRGVLFFVCCLLLVVCVVVAVEVVVVVVVGGVVAMASCMLFALNC